MSLMHFWRVFCYRWWLPLGAFLFFGGVGFLSSKSTPPTYQAYTRLLVNNVHAPGPPSYDDTIASASLANTYSQLVHSPTILQQTIDTLRLPLTPTHLDSQVNVQIVRNTPLLDIVVQDGSPTRAAGIADALARNLIGYVNSLQTQPVQSAMHKTDQQIASLQRSIAAATARLNRLRMLDTFSFDASAALERQIQTGINADQKRLAALVDMQRQLTLGETQTVSTVTSLGRAQVPSVPVQPQPLRTLALTAIIGFLLAFAVAVLLDLLDDRVREASDLGSIFGNAPLGIVRMARGPVTPLTIVSPLPAARSDTARLTDDLLLVRANLDAVVGDRPTVLCVSSPDAGDGKSTIAATLALLEAQTGKRVVLVDANLRDPRLHILFDLANDVGLSKCLTAKSVGALPPLQNGPLNIEVLTAGPLPPNPAALLGSPKMVELVHHLRAHADLVILDTAPIGPVPDAILLQRITDGTLLVVDARRARISHLRGDLLSIARASGTLIGYIINKSGQPVRRTWKPMAVQGGGREIASLAASGSLTAGTISSRTRR